jgi:hypothetical protein
MCKFSATYLLEDHVSIRTTKEFADGTTESQAASKLYEDVLKSVKFHTVSNDDGGANTFHVNKLITINVRKMAGVH